MKFDRDSLLESFERLFVDYGGAILEKDFKGSPGEKLDEEVFVQNGNCAVILPYNGMVNGLFLISLDESLIYEIIGDESLISEKNVELKRNEGGSVFKELLDNIGSSLLTLIRQEIPLVSISSPRIVFGQLSDSCVSASSRMIHLKEGDVKITATLDSMRSELMEYIDGQSRKSESKGQFLAQMSHEIRTPMNGMLAMAELLGETELTEEQREYADAVKMSGEALLVIINDILDFSKIESGKLEIEEIDFNIQQLVQGVRKLMSVKADEKGVAIAVEIAEEINTNVKGDPGRIRQILNNFLSNAIKFTEQGTIRVAVSLKRNMNQSQQLRFEVIDQGIGIPEERRKALFTSFTQVSSSTSRKYGGTGLGLAICKQLIGLMKGEIGADSVEGKGSTFWFELDLKDGKDMSAISDDGASLEGKRVLLINSNQKSRLIFKNYFDMWKCELDEAPSSEKGMKLLDESINSGVNYHLAIMSMNLPNRNGLELGQWIRGKEEYKGLPLILYTEQGMRGDMRKATDSGFQGYLSEPLNQSTVFNCVCQVLHQGTESETVVTKHLAEEQEPTEKKAVSILVAEDNAINQKVVKKALEKEGHQCEIAGNGRIAVEMYEKGTYDMVLMDIQMPEMNGLEATKAIRDLETNGHARTPIIACTANAMDTDQKQYKDADMDDFISKPLKVDKLRSIIERWGNS